MQAVPYNLTLYCIGIILPGGTGRDALLHTAQKTQRVSAVAYIVLFVTIDTKQGALLLPRLHVLPFFQIRCLQVFYSDPNMRLIRCYLMVCFYYVEYKHVHTPACYHLHSVACPRYVFAIGSTPNSWEPNYYIYVRSNPSFCLATITCSSTVSPGNEPTIGGTPGELQLLPRSGAQGQLDVKHETASNLLMNSRVSHTFSSSEVNCVEQHEIHPYIP